MNICNAIFAFVCVSASFVTVRRSLSPVRPFSPDSRFRRLSISLLV